MSWSVAKAKDNLSEVIRRSRTEGPQEISLHGEAAAVVLSAEDFRRLKDPRASRDFKDWLLNGPSLEGVDLERDQRPAREIDPFWMFLLDTNAISEPKRAQPNAGLIAWLSDQLLSDLHISVITVGELRRGIVRLDPGRRRDDLDFWLADLILRYETRILPVNLDVTERWASLAETNRWAGRASEMTDELIAATAHVHGLSVVTRNVRHFEHSGCRVLSPWSP